MENNTYQTFLNVLQQFAQDQTFYETELIHSEELEGKEHEEIIKLGGIMSQRLQKFAEKGESFAETLSTDFVPKLTDTMQSYQTLIVPPKPFGGFCPCLKPSRSGVEYDKRLLVTKAKMISAVFVSYAVIIENKGEQHNMDSMHYADYCNKMTNVLNQLNDVKLMNSNISDKGLEGNRKKLIACTEAVEKFIQHFGESGGSSEFRTEAERRVRTARELLDSQRPNTNRDTGNGPSIATGRRILIKVQSSLQEVMNSAASISSEQAKENLHSLDNLMKILKKNRETEINQFNDMEEKMNEYILMDVLHRLREDSEVINSDAGSKLRDAIKRWESVKKQSIPRKVAEYIEEAENNMGGINIGSINLGGGGNNNSGHGGSNNELAVVVDPKGLFKQAGRHMSNFVDKAKGDINSFVEKTNSALGNMNNTNGSNSNGSSGHGADNSSIVPNRPPPPIPHNNANGTNGKPAPPPKPSRNTNANNNSTSNSGGGGFFSPVESLLGTNNNNNSSSSSESNNNNNGGGGSAISGKFKAVANTIIRDNKKYTSLNK